MTPIPIPIEFKESDPLGGANGGEDVSIHLREFAEGVTPQAPSDPPLSESPGIRTPSAPFPHSPIFVPPPKSEAPAFHNSELYQPSHLLQKEEPQHRWICQLAATGSSTTEIAQATGFSTSMVANVKKQPWAQKYITELMERAGRKMVMNELCGHAGEAARLMIQSVEPDNPLNLSARDRVKAAHEYLNRCFGTAPATVITGKVDLDDLSKDELVQIVQGGQTATG